MTSSHIFFIPLVLLIGLVLGIALGRRSAFLQVEEEQRRAKREAERKKKADESERKPAPEGPSPEAPS
jgi:hypothetical protein